MTLLNVDQFHRVMNAPTLLIIMQEEALIHKKIDHEIITKIILLTRIPDKVGGKIHLNVIVFLSQETYKLTQITKMNQEMPI